MNKAREYKLKLTIKNRQQDSKSVSYKTNQTKYNLSAVNTCIYTPQFENHMEQ